MMLAYKIRAVQVSSEINLLKEVFIVNWLLLYIFTASFSIHSDKWKLNFYPRAEFYSQILYLDQLHGGKSVQIQSYFWSVFSCIRTEYRKIRTRNNSVFGHFSRIK